MLNAILADDEPIIIKGLKKLIPWQELGIQIVAEAWTGRGLLELVEREEPDLIITDISMPDGTGIDVIKEIQRRQLRTKVIFISAYQEFSYAKDALAFGAVDYLVKPIEKELLLQAVHKALSMLQEETNEQTSKGKLAVYEQKDKKTQLEELFDRVIEGDIRIEEAQRKLITLGASFSRGCYTVIQLELDHASEDNGRWGEHEKRLLLFAVSNMTDEMINAYGTGLVIRKSETLCAVVNHAVDCDILSLAEELLEKIRYYLKVSITVGVGDTVVSLLEMKASYTSAVEALRSNYFVGSGKVILSGSIKRESTTSERKLNELWYSIVQVLLAKEREKLVLLLEELLDQIGMVSAGSKEAAVSGCYSFLIEITEELVGVGITSFSTSEREQQDWLRKMHQWDRYHELRAFVMGKMVELLELLHHAGSGKEAQQMIVVKEYIDQHYQESITLESIASMVFMNPYYFSSFFKKHTNQNFKQYVTEVRLKNALKLLLQTDLMVYEIAEQVGYNNTRQFSDMFKKHYGKLPYEYKNQRQ